MNFPKARQAVPRTKFQPDKVFCLISTHLPQCEPRFLYIYYVHIMYITLDHLQTHNVSHNVSQCLSKSLPIFSISHPLTSHLDIAVDEVLVGCPTWPTVFEYQI